MSTLTPTPTPDEPSSLMFARVCAKEGGAVGPVVARDLVDMIDRRNARIGELEAALMAWSAWFDSMPRSLGGTA